MWAFTVLKNSKKQQQWLIVEHTKPQPANDLSAKTLRIERTKTENTADKIESEL